MSGISWVKSFHCIIRDVQRNLLSRLNACCASKEGQAPEGAIVSCQESRVACQEFQSSGKSGPCTPVHLVFAESFVLRICMFLKGVLLSSFRAPLMKVKGCAGVDGWNSNEATTIAQSSLASYELWKAETLGRYGQDSALSTSPKRTKSRATVWLRTSGGRFLSFQSFGGVGVAAGCGVLGLLPGLRAFSKFHPPGGIDCGHPLLGARKRSWSFLLAGVRHFPFERLCFSVWTFLCGTVMWEPSSGRNLWDFFCFCVWGLFVEPLCMEPFSETLMWKLSLTPLNL